MNRDAFLARVAAAVGRDAASPLPEPPTPPSGATVSPSTAGLDGAAVTERFVARLEAIGGVVRRAGRPEEAEEAAADAARTLGASVCASDDDAARDAARASGLRLAAPADADVGITAAWRGIAETGTVVLRSEPGRLEGLLPPVHVVVLREADIRRDLAELYAEAGDDLPAALVQITGPSRTADIEMTLTTGVHGPGTIVVVLVGAG